MPKQTLYTTQLLQHRFRLLRRIGAGGMGVVFEAFDERRGVRVALKTVEQLSAEAALQLKREFRVASQLRHPNLVRFFDLVVSAESCFFTMELVEGSNLISFIRGTGEDAPTVNAALLETMTPDAISKNAPMVWLKEGSSRFDGVHLLGALPQICSALDYLHQSGVIHRDLKPGNILVNEAGRVKLLDFGIARTTSIFYENEDPSLITGTPHYMSPEQACGEKVSPASDMYSLGVLLFLLLTGEPPFQGRTTKQILEKHREELPPQPSSRAEGVPAELEDLCLDLLEKDPWRRPSAKEAVERLSAMGAPMTHLSKQRPKRFVGREQELLSLRGLAAEVQRGARRAILIGGESGVGKSALCNELLRRLPTQQWIFLAARCYEKEQLTYNAIDPIIDTIALSLTTQRSRRLPQDLEYLAAMFPVLRELPGLPARDESLSSMEVKQRAERALGLLLKQFGGARSIALCLDDLQWADAGSLSLLEALIKGESSFLLLGTFRANEVSTGHPLRQLLRHPEASTLQLSRFGAREVRALFGEGLNDARVAQIIEETNGNAFLASELALSASDGLAPPMALSGLFAARQQSLSAAAQRALEVVVVAGISLEFQALQEVAGLSAPVLAQALDELVGERWLTKSDTALEEAYDTYHDRIREVLYAELPPTQKQELHRKLARVFASGDEPEKVANHWLLGGEPAEAAPWLAQAARKAASQLAFEGAKTLYQRATEAGGPEREEAQALREEQALMLERAGGRYEEAAAAYREAARYVHGMASIKLLLKAAESDLRRGDVDSALKAAAHAMSPYEALNIPESSLGAIAESSLRTLQIEQRLRPIAEAPRAAPSEHASLRQFLYQRIGTGLAYFDLYRAGVCSKRALLLSLEAGTDWQRVDALALYSVFVGYRRGRAHINRANDLYEQSTRWILPSHNLEMALWNQEVGGILDNVSGRFRRSLSTMLSVLERFRQHGFAGTPEMMLALNYIILSSVSAGEPTSYIPMLRQAHERASAEQDLLSLRIITSGLSLANAQSGRYDEAQRILNAVPDSPRYISALEPISATNQAMLFLAQGAFRYAAGILERLLAHPVQSVFMAYVEQKHRAQLLLSAVYLAQAKHAQTRSSKRELLSRAQQQAAEVGASDDPVFEGAGWRMLGLIAHARGKDQEATQWLDRAVASLAVRGEAIELSAALLARGAIRGAPADIQRGRAIFEPGGFIDPAEREGLGWGWR